KFQSPVRFAPKIFHEELLVLDDEFLDFIEQLSLQDPLLLTAASTETVDLVLQRRRRFVVQFLDDACSEPRFIVIGTDTIEKVYQMRPVDTCLSRVDDDEHLSRKITSLPIENYARHFNLVEQARILHPEKMQACKSMLPVDDQKPAFRVLQIADSLKVPER